MTPYSEPRPLWVYAPDSRATLLIKLRQLGRLDVDLHDDRLAVAKIAPERVRVDPLLQRVVTVFEMLDGRPVGNVPSTTRT